MDRRARILLVEDSPTQTLDLRRLLEDHGWEVVINSTAEEALRNLGRALPDLILVDLHLPYMSGDEFCRQARMRIDTRLIPIIMLTSDDSYEMETRGLESGADDFVRKSADREHLILRIRTMLRRLGDASAAWHPIAFQAGQSRVLAIDDSKTYLTYLQKQLHGESYELEVIGSPGEGLKRIEAGDIDCALVDLTMPEMNGIEVCKRIDDRRRRFGLRTMTLMLTANEDTQGLEQALEAGADDFVGKSSNIVVIKVRVRALLRRKFYEDENLRILEELKKRELEAERARMAQESAEARAALFDRLQQTASELARSNEELEEFAYAASHDLRSPLCAIANLADLLSDELDDALSDTQRAQFKLISGRVARLRVLVDDLLAYCRAGRPSSEPETVVDCADLLRDIVDLVDPPPEFKVEMVSPMPVITAAKEPLTQVFMNLIDNYELNIAGYLLKTVNLDQFLDQMRMVDHYCRSVIFPGRSAVCKPAGAT